MYLIILSILFLKNLSLGLNLSSLAGPPLLPIQPKVGLKEPRRDLLSAQVPSKDAPALSAVETSELRGIPLDLLEEVSKLSPPNNPVSPPMSTGETDEPTNNKPTNPTINTVNLNDLQDMGLRFKEPLGGSLVMDDMSQLQLQLQLQPAANTAQNVPPSNDFLQSQNIGQSDVHQVGWGNVQLPERSNRAQLQLQLELRDLIASGFDPTSRQSPMDMNFEPQEGPSGGRLKVNLNLSTSQPGSEPANVRLRPNQTPERTE